MQENQADVDCFVVGRAIRAVRSGQIHRESADSRGAIDEDLSAWEKQLPEPLRYHEGEPDPQAMQFAAMLMLGLQYVHDPPFFGQELEGLTNMTSFCRIVLHRKGFLDSKNQNESISMAPASANAVTRIVEELLSEGLLPRAQVHL
jgi:hypothetical protein